MDKICIVTSFRREELLWLCLEQIWKQGMNKETLVVSDRGYKSQDLLDTVDKWEVSLKLRENHTYFGNSFNLITSMKEALFYHPSLKILHVVEEDVIVHPGWFFWANQMLGSGNYACVVGRFMDAPNWYESPCVSWNVDFLKTALELITHDYFGETREHMVDHVDQKIFPDSKYKGGGAEQDGFFLRCVEHFNWRTTAPPVALATHLGWWGYNKMSTPPVHPIPTGPLSTRVELCRNVLRDLELRKRIFGHRVASKEWEGCSQWS